MELGLAVLASICSRGNGCGELDDIAAFVAGRPREATTAIVDKRTIRSIIAGEIKGFCIWLIVTAPEGYLTRGC